MAQRAGLEPTREFVAEVMARAREVNVTQVITVGDTLASSAWCVRAADEHPDVYAAVAVHPTEIAGMSDEDYAELERLARHPRVVAVGETGLDYYWDRTTPAEQQEHFRRHIDLAKRVGKTLMIHDRDAHADVLRVLIDEGAPERVVFHAFSGDAAMARLCVDAGYVLSVSGVATFTNAPTSCLKRTHRSWRRTPSADVPTAHIYCLIRCSPWPSCWGWSRPSSAPRHAGRRTRCTAYASRKSYVSLWP